MAHEISIEEEDFLIAENRHDEIIKSFNNITSALLKQDDKLIADAIKEQSNKFEDLAKSISEKPPINFDLNTKDFVTSILLVRDEIVESNKKTVIAFEENVKSNDKLREAIETRLLPDTFTLIKNYGVTESVKVNYKPSNQINITIKK